ncbi:uncharacterized protein LOC121577398 [Coregonus clupeaformis]|uniref:uncharacterized protein LOC121577398 n=1 Tax=Coregonus clupeaformis TaxID=59861 RepID=UPI001E1C8ADE|nr:uncharacterized protein LOC121577398 [Coregonus clupeaformis]
MADELFECDLHQEEYLCLEGGQQWTLPALIDIPAGITSQKYPGSTNGSLEYCRSKPGPRVCRSCEVPSNYRQRLHPENHRPERESDSAEYKFRFTTTEVKWGYSFPGITLNVTDLQVKETPATEEGKVTLTCSTTCTLTDNSNPSYIWYKNRQRLTNTNTQDNYLSLDPVSSEDTGRYSCTVEGYNNLHSPVLSVGEQSSLKEAAVGIIVVVLILILCLSGFMWFRKKASKSTFDTQDRRDTVENGQRDYNPVNDNVSGMAMAPTAAQRPITDDQDDVTHASIQHRNQEVPLYSTVPPPETGPGFPIRYCEIQQPQCCSIDIGLDLIQLWVIGIAAFNKQEENFQYAAVEFNLPSAAP